MNRILFAAFAVVVLVFGGFGLFGSSKAAVSPTDLVVGQIYEVADFRTCRLADGSSAYEWHFGGADRSRRNQLTPALDGRGRRILRRTSDIPAVRLDRVPPAGGSNQAATPSFHQPPSVSYQHASGRLFNLLIKLINKFWFCVKL